jgi:F0F1-type ATP synthase assembly protein I
MGFTFALSILLFVYVGQWLDRKLGTAPLFLVVGAFAGAGAGFYSIYRRLTAQQRREDEARRQ